LFGGAQELREALLVTIEEANIWAARPDARKDRAAELRRRADIADDAAQATSEADRLQTEMQTLTESLAARADVALGEILCRRCIKPGAVVTSWSSSRGTHATELSRRDFRTAVHGLGLQDLSDTDIDAVFNTFDKDGGGYLDAEEARLMIKGLEKVAQDAEHDKFAKRQAAERMRVRAAKRAAQAIEPLPVFDPRELEQHKPINLKHHRRKSKESAARKRQSKLGASKEGRPESQRSRAESHRSRPESQRSDQTGALAAAPVAAPTPVPLAVQMVEGVRDAMQSAFDMLFSSERTWRKPGADQVSLSATLARISQLERSRVWNTWLEVYLGEARLREIAGKVRQPKLASAARTWRAWCDEHGRSMQQLRVASAHLVKTEEWHAVYEWRVQTGVAMRAKQVTLRRLASAFARWRVRPTPSTNPCKALVKCLRCRGAPQ
jgi:hypothetical protein